MLTRSILLILFCIHSVFTSANDSPAILVSRYRSFLLQSANETNKIDAWRQSLHQGQWPDIDYKDQQRGNWKTREHLVRLQALSIAWAKPGSSHYGKTVLLLKVLTALDHWLEHSYQNSNWWYNEIGVPQLMRDIIIVLKAELSAKQWSNALAILAQLKVKGTGANLAWSADLGLHYAALTNDLQGIDSCRKLLINEITVSTREGVQPDFSFHQHGARLQNFHYGRSFLTENTRLAWQCRNTVWAFPTEKIMVLAQLLLDGNQWMARGKFVAPAVIDRAISRPGFLLTGDLSMTARLLKDLVPGMSKQLDQMISAYKKQYPDLGFKCFPYSDFAAYHDSRYSFYLKTISTRTLASETTTNSENLRGQLLNGGNTYFVRNGLEYADLMPVWDWNKLPGMTNFNGHAELIQPSFNGGLGQGHTGVWAMDYSLADAPRKLAAHKFWALYNNVVVCLIAGIKHEGPIDSIFTVMDQCRLQTNVEQNQPGNLLQHGVHILNKTKWIHHAGFAYFPLYDASISLTTGNVTGSWHPINHGIADSMVRDSIFMPVLLHPTNKKNNYGGYAVADCANATAAQRLSVKPSWQILSNTDTCQAVSFPGEIMMAAFFKKGQLSWNSKIVVANHPCIILINGGQLSVSDPGRSGGNLYLDIGDQQYKMTLPASGEAVHVSMK